MRLSKIALLVRARALTKTLRFKAIAGVVCFLCLVAVGLSTLFLATWEERERAGARRAALQTSAGLADVIADDVAVGDFARARVTLLAQLRHDPSILFIEVADASGERLRLDERCPDAQRPWLDVWPAGAPGDTRARTRARHEGAVLDVVSSLQEVEAVDDPPEIGRLRVAYALRPSAALVIELRWRVSAITLAMLVLGTAGTMFLMGRILGPLPELASATERVAQGDFESSLRVESDDELGVLARSFNQMTERLRWWQDRQRSWSKELEGRVAEKTREIAETREHLANIVENVGASILVADLDGTVISANTHTMHIFGMKPEFAVGRRLDEFTGDEGARAEALLSHLATGQSRATEIRLDRDGGRARDLLVIQTLLRDSGGHAAGFLQIAKDVTELKGMERRLVHSERLSAMGEMAGEIGHELNNYLMAIGGRAELIARRSATARTRGASRRSAGAPRSSRSRSARCVTSPTACWTRRARRARPPTWTSASSWSGPSSSCGRRTASTTSRSS